MKVAILYICIGKYNIFWDDFYLSCEKYFLPGVEKEYFVFTDAPTIAFEEKNKKINKIYQKNLGWPNNTLMRYYIFLGKKELFVNADYIFFFNANIIFVKQVFSEEFLPHGDEKFIAVLHSNFYTRSRSEFPYESRPLSSAFISRDVGKFYFQGAINGGIRDDFLRAMKVMENNIALDLERQVIALWHDESHWNKFLSDKESEVKILPPSYLYPEGFDLPFEAIAVLRGKEQFGGLAGIRGGAGTKLNRQFIKTIVTRIRNKIVYGIFSAYDSIFLSYFFVKNLSGKRKMTADPRRISVAITHYQRDDIIHKSLKNIITDDRVDEIVILDDGSNQKSFEALHKRMLGMSSKIKLFRREINKGVLATKIEVVPLCKNDWVVLLDSDNTILPSYLDELFKIPSWDKGTIYCSPFAYPLLDFRTFAEQSFDFNGMKEALVRKGRVARTLLNDGNFFLNKHEFLAIMHDYERFNVHAADIIFINYVWLSHENTLSVLSKGAYLHRIHRKSIWKETQGFSAPLFESLKDKFLISQKASYASMVDEIGILPEKNVKTTQVI